MSKYKVLVDSSVWISYFRDGIPAQLDRLIEEDLVSTNEVILTELIPYMLKANQKNLVEAMKSLDTIPLSIDWPIIREYQHLNLTNGLNKIGIPDLIILQQVIDHKLTLYSFDNHFQLMQRQLNFNLISE